MNNINNLIKDFFEAYFNAFDLRTVYTDTVPKEMMAGPVNENGYFQWKPLKGNIPYESYVKVMKEYDVTFPESFIEWHKMYFFYDGDCSIIRLPYSIPNKPLFEVIENLNNDLATELIENRLYPFADEGNDGGFLVFDGRTPKENNEFPIRFQDHEYSVLEGLSEVIFSSFPKMLECLTHYLKEIKTRKDFEVIPDFFKIDPEGAGKTGIDYWLGWVSMGKWNFEHFGE
ncbi:hypothetical protein ACFQ3S_05515 [Mucilaginibacter terrae]|uniref:hypothetical protein n=1 Tax=Mucilaginibacter terrae TaxID=1955052 RepID=UPI003624CBB3